MWPSLTTCPWKKPSRLLSAQTCSEAFSLLLNWSCFCSSIKVWTWTNRQRKTEAWLWFCLQPSIPPWEYVKQQNCLPLDQKLQLPVVQLEKCHPNAFLWVFGLGSFVLVFFFFFWFALVFSFLFVVSFCFSYEVGLSMQLKVAMSFLSGLLLHSWDPSSSGCSSSIRAPWLPGFLPGKSVVSQLELGLPGSHFTHWSGRQENLWRNRFLPENSIKQVHSHEIVWFC